MLIIAVSELQFIAHANHYCELTAIHWCGMTCCHCCVRTKKGHGIVLFGLGRQLVLGSVADPGCLSRILIFTHPGFRILDPGSQILDLGAWIQKQQQKRGEKKKLVVYGTAESRIFHRTPAGSTADKKTRRKRNRGC
jgi:hypothetical protein